jgi:chemotaxis signal transduction protein
MREATELRSSQQSTEAVWLARAKRLSQRARLDRAGQDALPVVILGIGKERYGIDLADVAEVFPPLRPTRVPGTAAVFAGVINVHGEIRPVIDLRRLLGIDPVSDTIQKAGLARVILLHRNGRKMGLQIDTVEQIHWVGSEESGSGDQISAANPQISTYIKGSTKDLLMLLSTEALFAELDSADRSKGVTN